ncbi:SURF1 family protein [Oleiagrimonas citrea]|uniref:SURF1 family protein n=1 Tax=Oleiagrimonas citrea TaxID=1665687 RepID=UPI0030846020
MTPTPPPASLPRRTRRGVIKRVSLATLALAAFIGFILLGNWQVRRLHWKLGLIHDVNTRVDAPPVNAPGPGQWSRIAAGHLQYLHVRLHGHYLPGAQTLVHGTSKKGYGFWVMAPLRTDRGFVVWVNRGYIPADMPDTPAYRQAAPPQGEVALTGLLRFSEPGGGFLRPNQPTKDQWYSRDVAAITAKRGLSESQVAPYFIDAAAREGAGPWPVAGLTVIHFPNHHLNYAITWYLLALGTALGVGLAIRRERKARHEESAD